MQDILALAAVHVALQPVELGRELSDPLVLGRDASLLLRGPFDQRNDLFGTHAAGLLAGVHAFCLLHASPSSKLNSVEKQT